MRYFITPLCTPFCLVLTVLSAAPTWAEDEAPDRESHRAEKRQQILEEFDADGDGKMSEAERATAREEMRSRRGKGKGKKRGSKDRRGPGGPPDPEKLFDEYDVNNDGQLSREEFMKLREAVRHQRRHGKRGGTRSDEGFRTGEGSRPDGSPSEDRPRFDRSGPLQNPGDRPGAPPREGRRRRGGDDGPDARGPNKGRGPNARGPKGHRPPSPEQVFERFDENGDDQLSRKEFMKLADRMREMRKQHGQRGQRGQRKGRGSRP